LGRKKKGERYYPRPIEKRSRRPRSIDGSDGEDKIKQKSGWEEREVGRRLSTNQKREIVV
jgi:hypothetical protein